MIKCPVSAIITPHTEHEQDDMGKMWYLCPCCSVMTVAEGYNYCPECGMKILWAGATTPHERRDGE